MRPSEAERLRPSEADGWGDAESQSVSASQDIRFTEIFSLLTEIVSKTCEASLSAKNKEINDLKRSKAACEACIDGGEMKCQIQISI